MPRVTPNPSLPNEAVRIAWGRLVATLGGPRAYHYRCVQADHQIRHSERLLSLAARAASDAGRDALARYYLEHLEEERGHERWTANDLALSASWFGTGRPLFEVAAGIHVLVEEQQRLLEAGDAVRFLGYVVALEGFPARADVWRAFAREHEIPLDAMHSPIRHAEADRGHARELFQLIEEQLEPAEREQVMDHAGRCLWLVADALLAPVERGARQASAPSLL